MDDFIRYKVREEFVGLVESQSSNKFIIKIFFSRSFFPVFQNIYRKVGSTL